MSQEFYGRQYRKLSGRRYAYLQAHLTPFEDGKYLADFSHFGRMMALSMCNADNSWEFALGEGNDCPVIESKVAEIVDEWAADEVLQTGQDLMNFNNMGLKVEETVEKN